MTGTKTTENGNGSVQASREDMTLAEAFLSMQSNLPAVDLDGYNGHFKNHFMTLGNLLSKVRPVLNRHGFAVTQMPCIDEQGRPALTTRFIYVSGETLESTMPLLLDKQNPQGLGSAITYAKRYALAAALGISDQEDDDGNVASEPTPPPADAINRDKAASIIDRLRDLNPQAIPMLFGRAGLDRPERIGPAVEGLSADEADRLVTEIAVAEAKALGAEEVGDE